MLDAYHLAWADEIVDALYALARENPDRPPSVRALATKLTECVPRSSQILNEGEVYYLKGLWRITYRTGLPIERLSVVLGHELGHWWFKRFDLTPPPRPIEEALCDAIGARLAAPKIPFTAALEAFDHRVHALAKQFRTTQTVSLLRICELAGRPGMAKKRGEGWIARGGEFEWAEDWREIPRVKAHYVKVDDRWGMLATR